jgi:hypothetical protein
MTTIISPAQAETLSNARPMRNASAPEIMQTETGGFFTRASGGTSGRPAARRPAGMLRKK